MTLTRIRSELDKTQRVKEWIMSGKLEWDRLIDDLDDQPEDNQRLTRENKRLKKENARLRGAINKECHGDHVGRVCCKKSIEE